MSRINGLVAKTFCLGSSESVPATQSTRDTRATIRLSEALELGDRISGRFLSQRGPVRGRPIRPNSPIREGSPSATRPAANETGVPEIFLPSLPSSCDLKRQSRPKKLRTKIALGPFLIYSSRMLGHGRSPFGLYRRFPAGSWIVNRNWSQHYVSNACFKFH